MKFTFFILCENPKTMIVKSKHFKNYTVIDNAILKEKNLSLKAKGLFCILSSLPSNWNVVQYQLEQFSNDGITATTSAFKELIEYGIVKVVTKDASKSKKFRGNLTYIVFPTLSIAEKSSDEEINEVKNQLSENPIMENTLNEIPLFENPTQVSIDTISKKIENKEKELFTPFLKVYFEFYEGLNGFPPKMNGAEGKALKGIIQYLSQCVTDGSDALSAWQYTLSHWKDLSAFTQRRMRLCDINSNLGNILIELKQTQGKQPTRSGNINKEYDDILRKLINQKTDGQITQP